MKLISVTILFICLIAATFSQWLMIACFDINQNYIAESLCINKTNAAAHCNGHCYLNKQLTNTEKQGGTAGSSFKEKFEIQLFCIAGTIGSSAIADEIKMAYAKNKKFAAQEFINLPFHPPSFL